ncbi:MAG: hypothetical protein FJZ89_05155 [Chloroflexi bacterium]|nr:hypothetical protein [Chloroflexota bacterium]
MPDKTAMRLNDTTVGSPYGITWQFDSQGHWTGSRVGRHRKALAAQEELMAGQTPLALQPLSLPTPFSPLEESPEMAELRRHGLDPTSGCRVVQQVGAAGTTSRTIELFQGRGDLADIGGLDVLRARAKVGFVLEQPATWRLAFAGATAQQDAEAIVVRWPDRTLVRLVAAQPMRVAETAEGAAITIDLPQGGAIVEVFVQSQPVYAVSDTVVIGLPQQMPEAAVVATCLARPGGPHLPVLDLPMPPYDPATFEADNAQLVQTSRQLAEIEAQLAQAAGAAAGPVPSELVWPGAPDTRQRRLEELLQRRESLAQEMAPLQDKALAFATWQRRWERFARLVAALAPLGGEESAGAATPDQSRQRLVLLYPYPAGLLAVLPAPAEKIFFLPEELRPRLAEWEKNLAQVLSGAAIPTTIYYRHLEDLAHKAWERLADRPFAGLFTIPDDPRFYPLGVVDALRRGRALLPKGRASDKLNLAEIQDRLNEGASRQEASRQVDKGQVASEEKGVGEAVIVEADGSMDSLVGALYAAQTGAALYVNPAPDPSGLSPSGRSLDAVARKLEEIQSNLDKEEIARLGANAYRYIGEHRAKFLQDPQADPRLKEQVATLSILELPQAVPTPYSLPAFNQAMLDYLAARQQQVSTTFRYDEALRQQDLIALEELVTSRVDGHLRKRLLQVTRLTVFTRGLPYTFVQGWGHKAIGHVIAEAELLVLRQVMGEAVARPPLSLVLDFDPGFFLPATPEADQRLEQSGARLLRLRGREASATSLRFYPQALPVAALLLNTHGDEQSLLVLDEAQGRLGVPLRQEQVELDDDFRWWPFVVSRVPMSWVGMGPACLRAGAQGYVAPLWSVPNGTAREVAAQFAERVLRGDVASEALAAIQSPDAAQRAFVFIGLASSRFDVTAPPEAWLASLDLLAAAVNRLAEVGLFIAAWRVHDLAQRIASAQRVAGLAEVALLLRAADSSLRSAPPNNPRPAEEARQRCREALARLEALPADTPGRAAWHALAWERLADVEATAFNDWSAAIAHYQDCLAAYQRLGDAGAAARVAFSLGLAQHLAGQTDAALLRLDEARRRYAALGDAQGVAESQYQIAVVHARREDWPQAEAYLLESARRFGDLGDALESMVAWRDLASIETELGKTGEGFRYLAQALNLSLSLGPLVWPTTVVHSLEVAQRALAKGAASEVLAGAQTLAAVVAGSRALLPPEREALSKVYAALQTLAEARSPELAEPQRSQRAETARALAREADAATGGALGVEEWVEEVLGT